MKTTVTTFHKAESPLEDGKITEFPVLMSLRSDRKLTVLFVNEIAGFVVSLGAGSASRIGRLEHWTNVNNRQGSSASTWVPCPSGTRADFSFVVE